MGKFKERYIEKSNEEFNAKKNKIEVDTKTIVVDHNGEGTSLEDYLRVSKGNV